MENRGRGLGNGWNRVYCNGGYVGLDMAIIIIIMDNTNIKEFDNNGKNSL